MLNREKSRASGRRMHRLRRIAVAIPRQRKRLLLALCDGALVALAVTAAAFLVFRDAAPAGLRWFIPAMTLGTVGACFTLGLYRTVTRFIGGRLGFRLLYAVGLAMAVGTVLAVAGRVGTPAEALLLQGVSAAFVLLALGGLRFFARAFLLSPRPGCERVLIYGAGSAGVGLEATLASQRVYLPIAFVDDDPRLHGSFVSGLPVISPSEVDGVVAREGVSRILLALPSATRNRRRKILRALEPLAVRIQTVPDIGDLLSGRARVEDIRDVTVHDILGREPVRADKQLLSRCVSGKTIMVTGAGGSIGSELCRQLIAHRPERLLLFELSEIALYTVERQLAVAARSAGVDTELVPLLGNIQDGARVASVLKNYQVDTIYHAAAYKHVPIVERNVSEGIRNNTFGTRVLAEAARQHGVGTFVLVSTDKAVSPTSVMGATKRLAELILQGMHQLRSNTRYCIVRFGNVLDSSGSVVPLFREQIRNGGPVTVTHEEVTRYFMTIPEAAQLVIQAGTMSQGGDVFVLEMGKPVKIADLATRLIRLMGLTVRDKQHPDGDIEICFTGLRPGEKLHEELLLGTSVEGTDHPKIMRAMEKALQWDEVAATLRSLEEALRRADLTQVRAALTAVVDGYTGQDLEDPVMAHLPEPSRPTVAAGASVHFLPGNRGTRMSATMAEPAARSGKEGRDDADR